MFKLHVLCGQNYISRDKKWNAMRCRNTVHNNIGILLFVVSYVYAFSVSRDKTASKFEAARRRVRGASGTNVIVSVLSPTEIIWAMLSSLVIEMAYLSVIGILFLFYWNYTVVGSVHGQLVTSDPAPSKSERKRLYETSPSALSTAIGDFFRADVLATVGYALAATFVFAYYYAVLLRLRAPPHDDAAAGSDFVSTVYMFNVTIVCGTLLYMMVM